MRQKAFLLCDRGGRQLRRQPFYPPNKIKARQGTNGVISETWECSEGSKIGLAIESAWVDCLACTRGHPGRPRSIRDLLEEREVTTPRGAFEGKRPPEKRSG